ncbi:MAG TPA: hypothetical protein VGL66_12885 [Caulobacteraceae bacterium]|jgi:hypothetical protein
MRPLGWVLGAVLVASVVAATAFVIANGGPNAVPSHSQPAVSPDTVILPESQTNTLLAQCSRSSPHADAPWSPPPAEIRRLETELPAALAPEVVNEPHLAKAPTGWRRQYVGFLKHGRHMIYGNYFKAWGENDLDWRSQAMMVCDGGPSFFGVEYDADAHRIVHIAFNGGPPVVNGAV